MGTGFNTFPILNNQYHTNGSKIMNNPIVRKMSKKNVQTILNSLRGAKASKGQDMFNVEKSGDGFYKVYANKTGELEQLQIGTNDDERLEIYEVEIMVDDTLITGTDAKEEPSEETVKIEDLFKRIN